MIIEGYEVPLVSHPLAKMPIYPHQAQMLDLWTRHEAFLLASKTGSGKTAAWVLAYLAHRHLPGEQNVVCVYPTNELIRDQERSIHDLIVSKQQLTCHVRSPDESEYTPVDVEIVRVDAETLERYCRAWKSFGVKTKGQALLRLLHADRPKIVLMNPDTLYMVFTLRYSQGGETLGILQAYRTAVFDEFHLYTGIELTHALFMVHLARSLNIFGRTVLLSATPHPDVRLFIDQLFSPCVVDALAASGHPIVGSRRITQQVELLPRHKPPRTAGGVVALARDILVNLRDDLEQLRANHAADMEYVPALVILNSVVDAIDLEDVLLGAGFLSDEIVPMRGLVARDARRLHADQLVIIGTSAVEVGIDFRTDYLIFEASDAPSFRQRLGRLGRHASGTAFFIGNARECAALSSLPQTINRDDFDRALIDRYSEASAYVWFSKTQLGAFTVMAQAYCVLHRVEADRRGSFSDKDAIRDGLFKIVNTYANRLGIEGPMGVARGMYKHHNAGKLEWIADYEQIDRFRTSLPSVRVLDRAEQQRGRTTFTYDADIKTLLARARNLRREGQLVVVDGYEAYHPVFTNMAFKDMPDKVGVLLSTKDFPNLMIKRQTQLGTLDIVSHYMSRSDDAHVFVYVPRDLVEDDLDWRVATFQAGEYQPRYIIAFDGDALLLKEIYRRVKLARPQV
jgi:CRISPR-associated endonuclease/helicase Cas3